MDNYKLFFAMIRARWKCQFCVVVMITILFSFTAALFIYEYYTVQHVVAVQLQDEKTYKKLTVQYNATSQYDHKQGFKILWYAPPEWVSPSDSVVHLLHNCQFKNCDISFDKKSLEFSDLVLFHHTNMRIKAPTKATNQKWVFVAQEPPIYTQRHFTSEQWKNKFDWTWSYRQDSQGYAPYGNLITTERKTRNYSDIFNKKTKDVAWIVSNCNTPSKRDKYVSMMKNFINVDIYGGCGKRCKWSGKDCLKNLSKDYKFYLSFENSICEDYVTEKAFNTYDDGVDIIPIVRGAPNIYKLLPVGTFITTQDFQSPKDLANYLKMVSSNESLYLEYFQAKDKFINSDYFVRLGLCSLCTKLNNDVENYSSLSLEKWISTKECRTPTDM